MAADIPLSDWLHSWAAGQLHWTVGTRQSAMLAIDGTILPSLQGEMVQGLTRARVQEAVTAWTRDLAPATTRSRWAYLVGPMRQAVADGLIERSPCEGVRLPPVPPGRPGILTVEQVRHITEAMTPRLTTMVTVAAATGMRSGELRGLTWDRISGSVVAVDRQLSRESRSGRPV